MLIKLSSKSQVAENVSLVSPQLFCEKNLNYIKPKLDSGKEWKPKDKEGTEQSPGQPVPPATAEKLGSKAKKVIAHLVVGDHLQMGDNKDIEAGPGKGDTAFRKLIFILEAVA